MKIHKVEQGTDEWLSLRAPLITASSFSKLITSKGGKSIQIDGAINEKVANIIAGETLETWQGNQWTERGHEIEPLAAEHYAFIFDDRDVQEIGFVTDDDVTCGCSPDRLVDEDGLLELKCPKPEVHINYMLKGVVPSVYVPQVQGQLMVTKRLWCDFMSYHPKLPEFIIRVYRDEVFIEKLKERIKYFNDEVGARVEKIKNR